MRTRRQTELSEVVRVRQAGQKSSEREKKKKQKVEVCLEGPNVSVI